MDNDITPSLTPGRSYYISLSREHNGRIKLSTSVHYNAPSDETEDESTHNLTKAIATAVTVGAIAQASLEECLGAVTVDEINSFMTIFCNVANTLADSLGGK